jgi:23S rRNA (uracil1939-C5)-methyltransferase
VASSKRPEPSLRLELDIDALAPGGEGVGHAGGRTVFVPFTAPGDRVVVEVPEAGGALHGELVELRAPGASRRAPACPHFGPEGDRCGGCEWQHAGEAAQLTAKAASVREALRKIGRIDADACGWRPPIPSPRPFRYRSRARFHLDRRSGRLVFFERRSHRPVPVADCHLLTEGLEGLRRALGPAIVAAQLSPGEVALEWSDHSGRGAAHLMLAAPPGKEQRNRAEALLKGVPTLAGVVLSAQGTPVTLVGSPALRHQRVPGQPAAGLATSRPDIFQQANRAANALLVEVALELLQPDGERVLELFCGSGNFTGPLAARAAALAAVEVQGPALELARADLAGTATRFYAGDALKLALALARERQAGGNGFTRTLLDPPRDGAKGIGPALSALGVERAVYVSCDPATLARDLRGCIEAGFRVEAIQPLDLFPQTHHVETVALLTTATHR